MEVQKRIYSTVVKQAGDNSRDITFVISDESPDRDGDIIMVDGWDFKSFMANPVCMGFHEYDEFPYGKFTRIEKDLRSSPRRVIGTVHFPSIEEMCPTGEVSEHAKNVDMAFNMCKNGYLNAVSVGCYYKEAVPRSDYPEGTPDYLRGRKVTKADLLEISLVPIPANANALSMIDADKSIDSKMKEYISKSFKAHSEEKTAIPFKHYALADEDTAWDGPKVIADSDIADLKLICTWYDSSKSDEDLTKGDFKLPHHMAKADGYKTVKKGVVAAVGALMGARGGVSIPESDVEKVKAHLKKHYEEFELDWPEEKEAWVEQAKSVGIEVETKAGRRLSAATMAQIDDLEKCMKELDEAIKACNSARDNMAGRIKVLKEGSETEETEEEPDEDMDGEKGVSPTVIKIVE